MAKMRRRVLLRCRSYLLLASRCVCSLIATPGRAYSALSNREAVIKARLALRGRRDREKDYVVHAATAPPVSSQCCVSMLHSGVRDWYRAASFDTLPLRILEECFGRAFGGSVGRVWRKTRRW